MYNFNNSGKLDCTYIKRKCVYCFKNKIKCKCKNYPLYHIDCLNHYKKKLTNSTVSVFDCPICYYSHTIMGFSGVVFI